MTALPDADALQPLEPYRRDVLARLRALEPIALGLLEAHGCVLAEDVVAADPVPGFANSAMDGYAVRAAEATAGAALDLVDEVAAGAVAPRPLQPGQAIRIMTGAPVPDGADAIVPVEVAEEQGVRVVVHRAARPGDHVRPAGDDVAAGTTVLQAGRRLGAADIGVLAAIGHARVRVHPRPRVAVVATGDELVEPDAPLRPGAIRDSNSYLLTAMVREAGATAFRQHLVRDERRALVEAFEGALSHADLLVTSGGVSAGRYDLVREVLAQLGEVRTAKVGMQPGMPQAFGFVDGVPVFGLPGNPVSTFVSFEVFVRPAIRRLQGRDDLNRPRVSAVLDEPVRSPRDKVSFLRVRLRRDAEGGWRARLTGRQGSGLLTSAAAADGLAEVPAGVEELAAGERVVVHLLVSPA